MDTCADTADAVTETTAPAWGAVFAMTLGVFGLITAEFLPASLLTPMALTLGVTEGMAGQTVTATAVVALFTSLVISVVTRNTDRRHVLLAFSVLLIGSNLLVAYAPNLTVMLLGRVLLGVAIGGFWTMSAATAMRLVPEAMVPRALSIIFSGVSVATVAAAPLGSYFGHLIGWRNVFLIATAIGVFALVWQWFTLPRMPSNGAARMGTLLKVMKRPAMRTGMVAVILVFTGHFAFFTYLRPFLETVTGVGVNGLSAMLLGFGIANFVGTSLAGFLLERNLRLMLLLMPLAMGAMALALVTLGRAPVADAVLVSLWGMAFGCVPVAWTTWITRTVPDEAESGGGLIVAAVQLAITLGAAVGGVIFDASGATGVFVASAVVLLVAAATISMRLPAVAALPSGASAAPGLH
ncbi:DHA1 family purine ribonucleoside efflux pump-like MFS transporter [Luteibacter sp. 1214]|uniref:MFS transporter n=1 Tax=Luteibacter sp. 1214 TaxID=2817735 RepID=UPI00286458C9|nr:MFS transporter [Luteibacter sp. 1214]MDR6640997.1 DHA1 family purine ribonucleoside efflux pump-like MFS transporter [Luteibacter sp. 1214]